MVRRGVAAGAGLLVLLLLIFGVKGCLDARKERSFENYARDLSSIVQQSNQLSEGFFQRLENPGKDANPVDFKAQIASDRSTAETLVNRVKSLDAPDEMDAAQNELVLAFELRRDGIGGIADQISTALGNKGGTDAFRSIADYMRYFLASDVLYERARLNIEAELDAAGVTGEKIPESQFLPEPVTEWLDAESVQSKLSGVAGASGAVSPGLHGTGLVQTAINGVVLTPDVPATISGTPPFEIQADVQNQGESTEENVTVSYELSGGQETIRGEATIPQIAPGDTKTASMQIEPDPPSGVALTLKLNVQPVGGEQVTSNNKASYSVTFP